MDKTGGRILSTGPMAHARGSRILDHAVLIVPGEGGEAMYNPLAIGVTLGGLLLDVVVPRPKPRAGPPLEPSLLSERSGARTVRRTSGDRARSSAGAKR